MSVSCSHLGSVAVSELPAEIAGCEDCLQIDARWLHLRMCMNCGHLGCCDSSPNRHARAHANAAGHPLIRSAEPGEAWGYCFDDDVTFVAEASN